MIMVNHYHWLKISVINDMYFGTAKLHFCRMFLINSSWCRSEVLTHLHDQGCENSWCFHYIYSFSQIVLYYNT